MLEWVGCLEFACTFVCQEPAWSRCWFPLPLHGASCGVAVGCPWESGVVGLAHIVNICGHVLAVSTDHLYVDGCSLGDDGKIW